MFNQYIQVAYYSFSDREKVDVIVNCFSLYIYSPKVNSFHGILHGSSLIVTGFSYSYGTFLLQKF